MNLVFLGPPGAGKGTMAAKLAVELAIPHISTGDIIRGAIRDGSPLGKQVKEIVERGGLVPDDLTIALVKNRLEQSDAQSGYILDGFPRTLVQARSLDEFATVRAAINFVLSEDEVVKRLSGRRVHAASGRTYHVLFSPPKAEGLDDVTGEPLSIRPDDQVDAIRKRLEVYAELTEPLIDYFRKQQKLVDLDSAPAPDSVFETLKQQVKRLQ